MALTCSTDQTRLPSRCRASARRQRSKPHGTWRVNQTRAGANASATRQLLPSHTGGAQAGMSRPARRMSISVVRLPATALTANSSTQAETSALRRHGW